MSKNFLKLADVVTVDEYNVACVLYEEDSIVLLDLNDQVLAVLPGDEDKVLVHIAVQGENTGIFYTFNLNQEFIGVSTGCVGDYDDMEGEDFE